MRVLVTGVTGFVGGWMAKALRRAGHEVLAPPDRVDVTDGDAVTDEMRRLGPDAVAHLAAVAFAPDAGADPLHAFGVTLGGTINVLEAVRLMDPPPAVLVSGSSEVYGSPRPADLPLTERSPLRPRTAYALSKAAQEGVCQAYAARHGLRLVVTRSFNHVGPDQRGVFVVPALAERVRAVAAGDAHDIPVGNLDVRRDLTDVRDVVSGYVGLLSGLLDGRIPPGGICLNVCSGRSVAIRFVLEELCRLAAVEPRIRVEPSLVRTDDPPEIRGDGSELDRLTGWRPTTTLETTLADVWASLDRRPANGLTAATRH